MLYKKIHRQYVKEFQVGRKYRFEGGEVYKITTSPYIGSCFIFIVDWELINIVSGRLWNKDRIEWLD